MYISFFSTRNFYGNDKISPYITDENFDGNCIYIDDKYEKKIMSKLYDREYNNIDEFKNELIKLNLEEFII